MKSLVDADYITEWLVLGPFFPDDLETDFLANVGGEANIQPQEGNIFTTAEGRTLIWKRYRTQGNIVDLVNGIGDYENAIAYAFCILQSEFTSTAHVHIGSDDGVAVWINGTQVHNNPVNRPLNLDDDTFEANLNAGANRCLVKVSQVTEGWGFAMRLMMLPPNRATLSGRITDEASMPLANASVYLKQDGKEIVQTRTDDSGNYRLDVYPARGVYDLCATSGNLGDWQFDFPLNEREHQKSNLRLKSAISVEGCLLMLDGTTPHVAHSVQAIMLYGGEEADAPTAATLSDEVGIYRFINLKPGAYKIRCCTPNGYIYYQQPINNDEVETINGKGEILQVERGKTLRNIDFCFVLLKKGTWKNYSYLDGLAANRVHAIHCNPDGVMWFATEGGISYYNGKEFITLTTKDGLPDNQVYAIHRDPDGVMWFGTEKGGISYYNGKEFITLTTQDGLANNLVAAVHRDRDGVMWFGTFGGVSRYDMREDQRRKGFINFTTEDGLAHNWVNAVHCSPDGVVWFGTAGGGVSCYDGREFITLTRQDGLAHNIVYVVYRAPDGAMWFGTRGGVSRYHKGEFTTLTTQDGLADNHVYAIHCTADGAMWFGTRGGVSRYHGEMFFTFTVKDGLPDNMVTAICCHLDSVMWFGTTEGISKYDGKRLANFATQDGLADKAVTVIHRDSSDAIWFGTRSGVSRAVYSERSRKAGRTFATFTVKDGLADNMVTSIYHAPDGLMWFGTETGISFYDGTEFVTFTTRDGLAHNWVNAIYCTPDGTVWCGTRLGGISYYDGKQFITLST